MGKNKKYPVKSDLNLAQRERRHMGQAAAIRLALGLALAIALFTKFGVYDVLNRVERTEKAALDGEQQVAQLQAQTTGYAALLEEYRNSILTQTVSDSQVDLIPCLDLLERELVQKASVSSVQIHEGSVAVQLSGVTLEELSAIYARLVESELVADAQLYTAGTGGAGGDKVSASITLQLAGDETEETGEGAAS